LTCFPGSNAKHYLSLKEAEEYLVDPISWFRKVERLHVDGG